MLRQTILFMMFCCVLGEEWFQRGSPHFINEGQFDQLINKEIETFKVVKYFTPYCRYCRFLKDIMDKIKQQGEWNYQFYDMNCQQNHRFCTQTVQIYSYPFMAIYNTEGEVVETMSGMYPEHLVKQMLLRYNPKKKENHDQIKSIQQIQEEQNKQKQSKLSGKSQLQKQTQIEEPKVAKQQNSQKNINDNQAKKINSAIHQKEQNLENYEKEVKQEQLKVTLLKQKQTIQEKQTPPSTSYISYLLYITAVLFGTYYFLKIFKNKKQSNQPNTSQQNQTETNFRHETDLGLTEVQDIDL